MKSLSISKILLSTVVAALCGCSSGDNDEIVTNGQWEMTGMGSKLEGILEMEGDDGDVTRSIFFGGSDGNKFYQVWDMLDEPMVYQGTSFLGTLKPTNYGVASSPLTGTLSGSLTVGSQFTIYTPTPFYDFRGQKGTIASMSADYSFMSATATVTGISGSKVTTSEMKFNSIVEYFVCVFRDMETNRLLHVKQFTIKSETGKFVETMDMLTGATTYTDQLVVNLDKERNTDDYPYTVYLVFLDPNSSTADTYSIRLVTGDGKTYEKKNIMSIVFASGKANNVRSKLTCIDVEAGVSTGITPPTDEDVVIDNVTKE